MPVSNVFVTRMNEANDSGKTFKSIHPGEEIHMQMDEDQQSNKEWDVVKPLHSCFRLKVKGPFVQSIQGPQYGTRTFVFEVASAGLCDIELQEVKRTWSWYGSSSATTPVPGGKQFKVSFQIK